MGITTNGLPPALNGGLLKMEKQQLYCRMDGTKLIEYDYLGSDIKEGVRYHTVYNTDNDTTQEIPAKEFHKRFSFEPIEEEEEEELNHPSDYDREMKIAYYGTTQVF